MFKPAIILLSLAAICFGQNITAPAVRFVNNIPSGNITFTFTNTIASFTLNYQEVTAYTPVSGGSVTVTSITLNGTNLLSVQQLVSFTGEFATVVATFVNQSFFLVKFNESLPTGFGTNPNVSYVRLVSLSNTPQYKTLAYASGTIAQYVTVLDPSPFVNVNPGNATNLRIFDSQNGTFNNPIFSFNEDLVAQTAYTVFYFGNQTGGFEFVQDRTVPLVVFVTTQPLSTGALTSGALTTGANMTTMNMTSTGTTGNSTTTLTSTGTSTGNTTTTATTAGTTGTSSSTVTTGTSTSGNVNTSTGDASKIFMCFGALVASLLIAF